MEFKKLKFKLFSGQHFQQPSDLPPTNGMQPQNMTHMNHMMGNLQMNTQPISMMQNHPMTFIQQTDSNQNIPLYQQQR